MKTKYTSTHTNTRTHTQQIKEKVVTLVVHLNPDMLYDTCLCFFVYITQKKDKQCTTYSREGTSVRDKRSKESDHSLFY